jgi:hypothetical protein
MTTFCIDFFGSYLSTGQGNTVLWRDVTHANQDMQYCRYLGIDMVRVHRTLTSGWTGKYLEGYSIQMGQAGIPESISAPIRGKAHLHMVRTLTKGQAGEVIVFTITTWDMQYIRRDGIYHRDRKV